MQEGLAGIKREKPIVGESPKRAVEVIFSALDFFCELPF
ncbi:Hypothetical protein CpCap5W_0407 [Corynebacterium pseudotuberculosis]|nr:Hypothetical protein Cp3995_0387 [Corynebacterium pseudotuberculosis 3/99-5]AIG06748.1 hypothetical protein CPTA_00919 [Corynebacterium pseudotuberculosis]AIG08670.1 hypothetical protein CPTB_00614 [Corynebacterium pseudotuberculosis]AIG10564.1 hypothetical protein CPTC_00276 [Corynebacterium pseudotuberculosis]ALP33121.1 Hypothetical protein CpN1_0398 [Corynebacterium pseudotuberculosis]